MVAIITQVAIAVSLFSNLASALIASFVRQVSEKFKNIYQCSSLQVFLKYHYCSATTNKNQPLYYNNFKKGVRI